MCVITMVRRYEEAYFTLVESGGRTHASPTL